MEDLFNLKKKVRQYQTVLDNTVKYRAVWKESLRDRLMSSLGEMIRETELDAEVSIKEGMENLEAVVLSLGETKSGIYESINEEIKRHLIKHNGSLIYQQLFNGKVIVLINYPAIEGYGQPRPPKTIAIYRPEEIKPPFLVRHMEEFIGEITMWEDYDDDEPSQKIGFHLNFSQDPPEE